MQVFHEQHEVIDALIDLIQRRSGKSEFMADDLLYKFETNEEQHDIIFIRIETLKKNEAGEMLIELEKDGTTTAISVEHWWRADAEESGMDIFTLSERIL